MPLSPEELLEWAEAVRKASEGETLADLVADREVIEEALRKLREGDTGYAPPPGVRYDCNCPTYGTCMNTACPRAIRVWSGTAGKVHPNAPYPTL